MSTITLDPSGWTVDAAPPVTLGTELDDGTFDERYIDVSSMTFIDNATTKTTKKITVEEGKIYCFSGGNRCRLLWVDDGDTALYASDEGNVSAERYAVAPRWATGVYYYYTTAGDTNASVKQVTGGVCPAFVLTGVNYRVRDVGGTKRVRIEKTGTTDARRMLAWADPASVRDGQITLSVLSTHQNTTTTDMLHVGPMIRVNKAAASESGYAAILRKSSTTSTFQISKYVNGTFTALDTASFTWATNEIVHINLVVKGRMILAKAWTGDLVDDEPAAWTVSAIDTSINIGTFGVFAFFAGGSTHYYEISHLEYSPSGSDTTEENFRVTQQYIEAACLLDSGTTVELDPTSLSLAIHSATVDIAVPGITVSVGCQELSLEQKGASVAGAAETVNLGVLDLSLGVESLSIGVNSVVSLAVQVLSITQNAVVAGMSVVVLVMEGMGTIDITDTIVNHPGAEDSRSLVSLSGVTTSRTGDVTVLARTGSRFWYTYGTSGNSNALGGLSPQQDFSSGDVTVTLRWWLNNTDYVSTADFHGGFYFYGGYYGGTLLGSSHSPHVIPTAGGWVQYEHSTLVPAATATLTLSANGRGMNCCIDDFTLEYSRPLPTAMFLDVKAPTVVAVDSTSPTINLNLLTLSLSQKGLIVAAGETVEVARLQIALTQLAAEVFTGTVAFLSPIAIGLQLEESNIVVSSTVATSLLELNLAVQEASVFAGAWVSVALQQLALTQLEPTVECSSVVDTSSLPLTLSVEEAVGSISLIESVARQSIALSILESATVCLSTASVGVQNLTIAVYGANVAGEGAVQVNALSLALAVLATSTKSDVDISLAALPLVLGQFATGQIGDANVALGYFDLRLRVRHPSIINAFPDQPIVIFFRTEKTGFERDEKTSFGRQKMRVIFKDDITGTNFKRGKA
jgi:hypothetical protein